MSRNKSIDVLKGIACLLVIMHHILWPHPLEYLYYIYNIAVPIFFMISGYLYFKDGETEEAFRQKQKRRFAEMTKLLVITEIGMFLFTALWYYWVSKDRLHYWLLDFLDISNVLKGLTYSNVHFVRHIWYLFALAGCYGLAILFIRKPAGKNMARKMLIFAGIFLLIRQAMGYFLPLLGINAFADYSGIYYLQGIPFLLFGGAVKKLKENILQKTSAVLWIALSLAGFLLSVIEYRTVCIGFNLPVGTVLFAISVFILFSVFDLGNSFPLREILAYIGKELSLYIYIVHYPVIMVLTVLFEDSPDVLAPKNAIICAVLTYVVSIAVAVIYSRIKKELFKNGSERVIKEK